jgi:hypothetical protein
LRAFFFGSSEEEYSQQDRTKSKSKELNIKFIFKIKTTRNMHSVLSPLAQPFQPVEFAIYNDGVPSSVYYGSHPEHEVLMHIEDEALDETFPPSAHDVSYFIAAT